MPFADVRPFSKARRFVDHFLYEADYCPRTVIDATQTGRNGYIFRGQLDGNWPLLPTAHRSNASWRLFTPQGPSKITLEGNLSDRRVAYALGTHLHAELRSVLLFLESADRMGIMTPLNYDEFVAGHDAKLRPIMQAASVRRDPSDPSRIEEISEEQALLLADSLKEFPIAATLPSFALAQHYGVITRLLDWTESPLVAAFFAARRARDTPDDSPQRFAVIALDTEFARKRNTEFRIVKAPKYINPNQRGQRGLFTWIPDANDRFRKTKRWESLDERVPSQAFRVATLPVSEAGELLQILWRLDVTAESLLPSLNSAAGTVEELHKTFGQA